VLGDFFYKPTAVEPFLILPQKFQSYTLYSDWEAIVARKAEPNNSLPGLKPTRWHPIVRQDQEIPTIHLIPEQMNEVEIRTDRATACQLERNRSSDEESSTILFQISGRSDEYNIPRKLDIRLKPTREDILREMLKTACAQ
jgi:hypothetical protein